MKTMFTVFLAIAVLAFGWQWKLEHDEKVTAQLAATDAKDKADQITDKYAHYDDTVNQLNTQIASLKAEVDKLNAQLKQAQAARALNNSTAPASPAPPVQQTSAQASVAAQQLLTDYAPALVIIDGNKGKGSGFICTQDGHTYVITNAHVVAANTTFTIANMQSKTFKVGDSAVAVGHDLVRIEVTDATKTFDMLADPNASAKVGDAVIVPGNSEGAGVIKPVEGKIVGIGPDLIEVDAPFVPGNSGSPIIHVASGKVIGVATYATVRSFGQGGVKTDIRRFGYRLDNARQWEPLNWQTFFAQAAQLAAIETLSRDFIRMFGAGKIDFDPAGYTSESIKRRLHNFMQEVKEKGTTLSQPDRKALVERLVADLRNVSQLDIYEFGKTPAYDYFRREVDDQKQFRQELYDGLTKALQNM